MASLKVAVRVRPFNQRERDMDAECIIEMHGKKTCVLSSGKSGNSTRDKEFTFDYSYWSHSSDDSHFISQEQVFSDLGTEVVDSAFSGYNACVFAYGQTGSGKTFTMMGSPENQGLIPRICKALFSRMHANIEADNNNNYRTEVSYLEIYNERVKDLLQDTASHSLRVRNGENGVYVENLSKHLVSDYSEIQAFMMRGNRHRTTASTNMNDVSSRSHAIFTIKFIQASFANGMPSETVSKIHLVDLAGSERAAATGATGQRLKEGAHINKSLVTLGSVISALAELSKRSIEGNSQNSAINNSGFKSPKTSHVPYRDSVLTYLLKDSLGGNSKTIMIAAISPADCNRSETMSTLRYANRAKNIINQPTVNEDANVKLIRELRIEIARLKAKLACDEQLSNRLAIEPTVLAQLQEKQAQEKDLTEKWEEKWSQTQVILREERALGLRKSGLGVVLDSEIPHLVGIGDDLLSTGVTLYHLKEGETLIGSDDGSVTQDIAINAPGVESEHCSVVLNNGVATLIPKQGAQCWINNLLIDKPTRLSQGCIIVLGGTIMFRYNDPVEAAQMRKEGSRSQLNLSRQSLLSWSTNDLATSIENLDTGEEQDIENQRASLERDKEKFAREQAQRELEWAEEQQKRRKALEAAQKQLELERQRMEEEYQHQRLQLTENWRKLLKEQEQNALLLKKKQIELKRKYDLLEWERNEKLAQADNQQLQVEQLENEIKLKRDSFKQALESLVCNANQQFCDNFVEKMLIKVQETPLSEESDFIVNLLKNADHKSIDAVKDLVNQHKKELLSLESKLRTKMQTLTTQRESVTRIENELAEMSINSKSDGKGDSLENEQKLIFQQRSCKDMQDLLERKQSLTLNLKHSAHPSTHSTTKNLNDVNLESSASPEDVSSKSSSDYSSPLKTCDTFHTATSACSINSPRSICDVSINNSPTNNTSSQEINDNEKTNETIENNNLITTTVSIENNSSVSDSDEVSSADDFKAASAEDGNSAQSSSSFEKLSSFETYSRQKRRAINTSNTIISGRKLIGGEEAAIRAMKRLSQRMARQKMMILRNIENDCGRDELNEQISLLQELQKQYVKLEMALQNCNSSNLNGCESEFVLSPDVLSPTEEHPLNEQLATHSSDNQLFLGDSPQISHFRVFNNISNNSASNQQGCHQSIERISYQANGEYRESLSTQDIQYSTNRYSETSSDADNHSELSEDDRGIKYKHLFSNSTCNRLNSISKNSRCSDAGHYTLSNLTKSMLSISSYENEGYPISIPNYFLRGAGSKTHFEYEVRINVQGERWSLLRRYRKFRELHLSMRSKYGHQIDVLPFPSRQLFSSTSETVARERRSLLESYLRRLLSICTTIPNCPLYIQDKFNNENEIIEVKSLSESISKKQLLEFSPFFRRGIFESSKYGTS